MIRKLLLVANSRKLKGRCLAGIDLETGEWIRPVSDEDHGAIPPAWCDSGGRSVQPLDVVEVDLQRHVPMPHQPENWLMGSPHIKRSFTMTLEQSASLLLPQINRKSVLTATEKALKAASVRREPVNASLSLFGVDSARVGRNDQGKLRVWFRFLDQPWELSYTGVSSPEIEREHASALICVSLAEEWRDEHWKLAASLIPVPSVGAFKFAARTPITGNLDYLVMTQFGRPPAQPASGRLAEGTWFHQCQIPNHYVLCGHETVEVFRRHYVSRNRGENRTYHYFALYCRSCDRLETTSNERKTENAKLAKDANAVRAVTAVCPECSL